MAYCLIVENPEAEQQQFEQVIAHVRGTGSFPPEGQRLIVAGPADPGWRVISIWDTQQAYERFNAERLIPAIKEAGVLLDCMTRKVFEVYTLVAGDLIGAPQPA